MLARRRLKALLGGLRTTGRRKRLQGAASRLRVEGCHGAQGRGSFDDDCDVLVCTYERANGVLNRALDEPEEGEQEEDEPDSLLM